VVVTTVDGLYRYDMNDIAEVVDRHHRAPTLTFIQKGKGVTNITGEKLHESQLIAAVVNAGRGDVPGAGFFLALADDVSATYRLYLEAPLPASPGEIAAAVDEHLAGLNIEYRAKRASGRLGPVRAFEVVPGTGDAYRRWCLGEGQRDAQFKVMHLQRADACSFDLDSAVLVP
jgi:hypothetical protein